MVRVMHYVYDYGKKTPNNNWMCKMKDTVPFNFGRGDTAAK